VAEQARRFIAQRSTSEEGPRADEDVGHRKRDRSHSFPHLPDGGIFYQQAQRPRKALQPKTFRGSYYLQFDIDFTEYLRYIVSKKHPPIEIRKDKQRSIIVNRKTKKAS